MREYPLQVTEAETYAADDAEQPQEEPRTAGFLYGLIRMILVPLVRVIYRPQIEGRHNVPHEGAIIFASNHLSFIDSIAIPVVMVDTDTVMPIGRRLPHIGRVGMVLGEPLDFSRFAGMEGDRYILRSVTDEIMVALQRLGEQTYDDVYASSVKNRLPASPAA